MSKSSQNLIVVRVGSLLYAQDNIQSILYLNGANIQRKHTFFSVQNITTLSHFLKWLNGQTSKWNIYLSAVLNMQISLGLPDPRDQSSLPILKRVQDGVARAAKSRGKAPHICLPITHQLMTIIKKHLTVTNHQERTIFWAISCNAFSGFFHLGELLPISDENQDPSTCLQWGDVAVDDRINPTMFKLFLRQTKCDQFGNGTHIILGQTTGQACPMSALTLYLGACPHTQGSLFLDSQAKPVNKIWFVVEIRSTLKNLGYSQDKYVGNSYRIGAATTVAQNGLEDSVIQTVCRWHSSAFLQHIKTPQTHLADLSQSLTSEVNFVAEMLSPSYVPGYALIDYLSYYHMIIELCTTTHAVLLLHHENFTPVITHSLTQSIILITHNLGFGGGASLPSAGQPLWRMWTQTSRPFIHSPKPLLGSVT